MQASGDREVLVYRPARKVGVGLESTVDLGENLQARTSSDAGEVFSFIDGLKDDHELWVTGAEGSGQGGLLIKGVVEVSEATGQPLSLSRR